MTLLCNRVPARYFARRAGGPAIDRKARGPRLMKTSILVAALIACIPATVVAEMYKCKRPDGKTSFQDSPCEKGAESSPVIVNDPSPAYDPGAKAKAPTLSPKADKQPQSRTPIADEIRQRNRQLEAQNRAMACTQARRNVDVLKRERPVYSVDKNGNKVYVEDANRAAELAAAQGRVSETCN